MELSFDEPAHDLYVYSWEREINSLGYFAQQSRKCYFLQICPTDL